MGIPLGWDQRNYNRTLWPLLRPAKLEFTVNVRGQDRLSARIERGRSRTGEGVATTRPDRCEVRSEAARKGARSSEASMLIHRHEYPALLVAAALPNQHDEAGENQKRRRAQHHNPRVDHMRTVIVLGMCRAIAHHALGTGGQPGR